MSDKIAIIAIYNGIFMGIPEGKEPLGRSRRSW
jgi:hypothetical protein